MLERVNAVSKYVKNEIGKYSKIDDTTIVTYD